MWGCSAVPTRYGTSPSSNSCAVSRRCASRARSPAARVFRPPQNEAGQTVDLYIPRKCSWTNRILRRDDFAYFGLIGSKTKRARFEHRMAEHGIDPSRFAEMTCPMGVCGITDKAPAMIAVAIVAQLLQVRDQRLAHLGALVASRSGKATSTTQTKTAKGTP